MKKLIFLLVLVVIGCAIWFGYIQFNRTGDKDNPGVNVTVDKAKVHDLEHKMTDKAKDALHNETANP